jgi:hypothetical protein
MLLRITIKTRRVSLCYCADEIEAPNACDREAEKYHGRYPVFICELFSRLDSDNMVESWLIGYACGYCRRMDYNEQVY